MRPSKNTNMKIFQRNAALCLLLVALLNSCIKEDDFDFNNMAANQWDPELAAPLINSSLSIQDITGMTENDMFTVNNGVISLIYSTNIFKRYGFEFFTPASQTSNLTIQMTPPDSTTLYQTGTVSRSITPTMPLSFPNGEQIDSMVYRSGQFNVTLTSYIPHDAVLNVTIPSATLQGQVFSKDIPVSASTGVASIVQGSFDMTGYSMGTNKNGMPNQVDISYTLTFTNSNTVSPCLNLNFDIISSFDSIAPAYLFGYFGQSEFAPPPTSSPVSIFNNFQGGSVFFDDPRMTITLTNSFGMPIDAKVNSIRAEQSSGANIPFNGNFPNPLITYPIAVGQAATNSIYFDKNNSNIQQLVNASPVAFNYNISAGTNAPLPAYNFMSDSSEFSVDMKLELPLSGHATGFVIQDTLDISLGDVTQISSILFRLNVTNGFPVNANTQVYFLNDSYAVLDSLISDYQNRLVESAEVDANGKATTPTVRAREELFDGIRLSHLFDAKKVIIRATIDTYDAPNTNIDLYDDYKIDFKLGARTKLNIEF